MPTADHLPIGQMLIKGVLAADAAEFNTLKVKTILAEQVLTNDLQANQYIYRGVPFAPTILKVLPHVMPGPQPTKPPADAAQPAETAPAATDAAPADSDK